MTTPKTVAPGVERIDTHVTGTDMPLAVHAVWSEEGWTIVDTGCVGMIGSGLLRGLETGGRPARVARAIVTHAHADHFGGNFELLAANPRCTIYAHALDVAWARDPAFHVRDAYDALEPDVSCPTEIKAWVAALMGPAAPVTAVREGHTFACAGGTSFDVVHLPGHSPGHVGLWDPAHATLILGDALLGDGQRVDGHVVAIPSYLDVDHYLGSIATVRSLAPTTCLPSHFAPMDARATQAFCDASEAFVRRLDDAVHAHLHHHGPSTLADVTSAVVPRIAPGVEPSMVAALSVHAHLASGVRSGTLDCTPPTPVRRWSVATDPYERSEP